MANNNQTTSVKETKTNKTTIKSLEQQIAEQQEQIKQLMEMLQNQNNNVVTNNVPVDSDIGAEEEILVISLTPNKLNLVGNGGVVLFSFDNMYEEQYIDYTSLKEIVRLNRDMAKNG